MIGIKVNGLFLDLKPGTSSEIERKSPFFAIDEYASESTTEALIFPYTPNNAVALELPHQYFTERKKQSFKAEHYDGNTFRGNCTLVIETGKLNLNRIEATEISGYIMYSISNFFQDIKGKKLSDLTLGGTRSFNWTTNNPADGSGGFWQHIHASWIDSTIPYVFQPIRNEGYFSETNPVDWMNKLNDQATLLYDFTFPLVPMIRLKYLLEQIFLFTGYTVDFAGLNDTDWEKLILVNLVKVQWYSVGPVIDSSGNSVIQNRPAATTQIDLRKHVPQDKAISDFILQLFYKYGWAPLFDPLAKRCRLVAAKELGNISVKDWTHFANPQMESSFNEDTKTFAFTNEIDSNDQLPKAPDLANLTIGLPATNARFLPTPTPAEEGLVRFCYHDNQWWQVKLDATSNLYEWELLADNIYDDEPPGNTDTIATTISTLPSYFTDYRTEGGISYSGYFPAMKQEATKNIGYRTLLYHGMRQELAYNGSGSGTPKQYPHASATREDPLGTIPLVWSNVIKHPKFGGTAFEEEFGIRKYWWSSFLSIMQAGEKVVMQIYLPLDELTKFAWDDKILIRHLPYLVKSFIEPTPFTGFIQATMIRLTKRVITPVVVDNTGTVVNGVYARITTTELSRESRTILGTVIISIRSDVRVLLYSNQGGTIPYTPPAPLYAYVRIAFVNNLGGTPSNTTYRYYEVNSASQVIIHNEITAFLNLNNSVRSANTYSLDPAGANGYVVII